MCQMLIASSCSATIVEVGGETRTRSVYNPSCGARAHSLARPWVGEHRSQPGQITAAHATYALQPVVAQGSPSSRRDDCADHVTVDPCRCGHTVSTKRS